MKTTSLIAVGFGVLLALTEDLQADLIFYNDRSEFEAALTNLSIEDFEEANVDPFSGKDMGNPLDEFTDNDIFQAGDITSGLRIQSTNNSQNELLVRGQSFNSGKAVFANADDANLDALFLNQGVNGAGAVFLNALANSTRRIAVFSSDDSFLGQRNIEVTTSGTFLGVVSTGERIGRLRIDGQVDDFAGVDEVLYSPVPEPSCLVAISVMGCSWVWSKLHASKNSSAGPGSDSRPTLAFVAQTLRGTSDTALVSFKL